ncbi:MAG: alpha/beta fold hydrolase [Myxococcota bacterium]
MATRLRSPAGTSILFAHGAGAPSTSDWMTGYAKKLRKIAPVTTFDYPYMAAGRKMPDRLPRLVDFHRRRFRRFRSRGRRVVLAGKSMGSRVGCHVAVEETEAPPFGLVCFGYPLIGVGKKKPRRDQVLLSLQTPVLFVQGTRDPLCPIDELERVRGKMRTHSQLLVVEGGNHSLQVARRVLSEQGQTQADVEELIIAHVAEFVRWVCRATDK